VDTFYPLRFPSQNGIRLAAHKFVEEPIMAKVRSPNYPTTDLGAALELIRPAFKAENRNKMSRLVLANHMGDKTLNGRALTKLGAARAYGLIEGSGDQLRLSDDAVLVLASPNTVNVQYRDALERLAFKPSLFQEIKKEYPATLPSENNLSFWLVQKHFTQQAAGKAAQSFLATMRVVYPEPEGYNPPAEESIKEAVPMPPQNQETRHILDRPASSIKPPPATAPMLQETFNLDEGPVTLAFPSNLTQESYEELEAALQLFLRRAKRRALWNDPAYIERRKAEIIRRANQVVDDDDTRGED
jgi:hypothetical protein